MELTQIKALSRHYNKKWLEGDKADLIIGTIIRTFPKQREEICYICKRKIYLLDLIEDNDDLIKKNAKPVCPKCCLELDKKEKILTEEQREMLSRYEI